MNKQKNLKNLNYKACVNSDGLIVVGQPKADIVYADPPWDIQQKGHYGAEQHYNLMTLDRIKGMPVADLCKENAACFLWATNAAMPDALDVLEAWGFTYRGYYFWGKSQLGLGQYFRNATEVMLLGTKGKMPVDCKNQPNWNLLPRQEHSKKPEEIYALIERMYRNRDYLELFARKRPTNKGWRIWGDQAEGGSDIYIPGYPVPEYSDMVHFAKDGDLDSDFQSDIFTDADMETDTPDQEGGD